VNRERGTEKETEMWMGRERLASICTHEKTEENVLGGVATKRSVANKCCLQKNGQTDVMIDMANEKK
jgi:hypothetical protein